MGAGRITDWLSPGFFETEFWYMWSTTFAFQPWHSAVEFKRYLHRFMLEFSRIETLAGVKRTIYNQNDSLVRPLTAWLAARGVRLIADCRVVDIDHEIVAGLLNVTGVRCSRRGEPERLAIADGDLVFLQNASMTDASSFGSMTRRARETHEGGERRLVVVGETRRGTSGNSAIPPRSTARSRNPGGNPSRLR